MLHKQVACALFLFALGACTTVAESNPQRTATEQMLISSAAERAAAKLALQMPEGKKAFIDTSNFEGTDSKYAVQAIRTTFMQQGLRLVDDKKDAQVIIETGAGALSIDKKKFLIGIPQFTVPVPLASGPLTFPEIALYSSEDQNGVAKFTVVGRDAKKGTLIATQEPQYGFSHHTDKIVLVFVSWTDTDGLPDDEHSPISAVNNMVAGRSPEGRRD
jgi:hypothetical protein